MKAKKDGKLSTSPEHFIDDLANTGLGPMPDYIETRSQAPGSAEAYPNYHMGSAGVHIGHTPGNIGQNCMMPPYVSMGRKM